MGGMGGSRFDMDAADRAGARRYLRERAQQALVDRFRPASKDVEPLITDGLEWGAFARAASPEGIAHQTFYVYKAHRGQGRLSRYLASTKIPVVTIPDCNIEAYLAKKNVPFRVIGRHTKLEEYVAIEAHYGDRVAERSRVPYMHHIDQGIAVLDRIGASERAKRAFCLHPLVQLDDDLNGFFSGAKFERFDRTVLMLAMEYRNIANATLSHREIQSAADIPLSPLADVNAMLVADKVQNRKDFILHHRGEGQGPGKHPRSDALDRYFRLWLERLGVSEERFEELFADLNSVPMLEEDVEDRGAAIATRRLE
jgi:hypothetical protein